MNNSDKERALLRTSIEGSVADMSSMGTQLARLAETGMKEYISTWQL